MKRILIVETSKVSSSTSVAHVRNSIELQKFLNINATCELVDLYSEIDVNQQWDIILFSYASMRADFSKLQELINNQINVKIGWITNEFELFANDFVKKNMTFMINNFNESGIKRAHKHDQLLTTNLNTLIAKERNRRLVKKYDICYYGTYRKYREIYFQKYFKKEMILSTSKKNWKKFIDIDILCNVTEKFAWIERKETLNLFRTSLYIEDTKTHECFNYMANRFFEGLYCNTPLFFDSTCKNTIEKDIYQVDDYFIVSDYDELILKSRDLNEVKVEEFLSVNSEIALEQKKKSLNEIEEFLTNL